MNQFLGKVNLEKFNFIVIISFIIATILLLILILTNSIDKNLSVLFILFGAVLTTAWTNHVMDYREKKKEEKSEGMIINSIRNILIYNSGISTANIERLKIDENRDIHKLSTSFIDLINLNLNRKDLKDDFINSLLVIGLNTDFINNQIDKREKYIFELVKNYDRLDEIKDVNVKIFNKQLIENFGNIVELINKCDIDKVLNKKFGYNFDTN